MGAVGAVRVIACVGVGVVSCREDSCVCERLWCRGCGYVCVSVYGWSGRGECMCVSGCGVVEVVAYTCGGGCMCVCGVVGGCELVCCGGGVCMYESGCGVVRGVAFL